MGSVAGLRRFHIRGNKAPTTEACAPGTCALQQEQPLQWEVQRLPQPEQAHMQQRGPRTAIRKGSKKTWYKGTVARGPILEGVWALLLLLFFFIDQFSHPYMTTGKTIALTRWTFVGKVMSLLFYFFLFIFISWRIITLHEHYFLYRTIFEKGSNRKNGS